MPRPPVLPPSPWTPAGGFRVFSGALVLGEHPSADETEPAPGGNWCIVRPAHNGVWFVFRRPFTETEDGEDYDMIRWVAVHESAVPSLDETLGRIERGFLGRPDLVAIDNPVNPRAYLGRFYLDSLTHDPDQLRFLLKLAGAERVALGSDYPFPLGEPCPGEMIESMPDLSPATKERLFAGTALEFLGLPPGSFAA